jgi:hypothetical protein
MAGVLKAAAATVAMASMRSFIFYPLEIPTDRYIPARSPNPNAMTITTKPRKVSTLHAALRGILRRLSGFYPQAVTPRQQQPKNTDPAVRFYPGAI